MPSPAQLKLAVDDLEALTSVHAGNDNLPGLWRRFALAAEEAAGASTTANETTTGYMLRSALALESIAGTSGAEENVSYEGLLKRIVDALEVQAGGATTGSLEGRLVVAADNAEFWSPAMFPVWLDPSDTSTLWQDAAGTTPATADNDPVRRVDNKGTFGSFALAASDAERPLLKVISGRNCLRGDGAASLMTIGYRVAGSNTARFIATAYNPRRTTGIDPIAGWASGVTGSTWYFLQSRTTGAVGDPYFAGYSNDLTGPAKSLDLKVGLVRNTALEAYVLRKNAAQVNSQTKVGMNVVNVDLAIFKDTTDFGQIDLYGLVAGGVLSDADMAKLETHLGAKVGLTI